jgi:phosphatidylserine decarboxylase
LYSNFLGRALIKLLINPTISDISGKLLNTRLSTLIINTFINNNNIDMTEYVPQKYTSYNQFFVRKIKPEARPFSQEPYALVSPCDGKLSVYKINKFSKFNIKDTEYTLSSLLKDPKLVSEYNNGYCLIIRLSVDDYHRYHNIDNGEIISNRTIKGFFHTVNPIANDYYPIYKENTREYTIIQGETFDKYIQMEVGAMMVGKIVNRKHSGNLIKFSEKGHFEFGGSTVILLFKENQVSIDEDLIINTQNGYESLVKLGEKIGCKAKL